MHCRAQHTAAPAAAAAIPPPYQPPLTETLTDAQACESAHLIPIGVGGSLMSSANETRSRELKGLAPVCGSAVVLNTRQSGSIAIDQRSQQLAVDTHFWQLRYGWQ